MHEQADFVRDRDWLRQSFMLPRNESYSRQELREIAEAADFKFTDTTLGGNFAINPPPQFTRYADRKVRGLNPAGSRGMGRYYSEALDDNGQYIHMRFGVPKFNSLTNFFFNFYNPQASQLARTGRADPTLYSIGRRLGQAAGFVVTLPAQPIIWAGSVIRFLRNKPVSRFYYLKPAMPLYWNAVATMVNMIGVNMGVIARGMTDHESAVRGEEPHTKEMSELYHQAMGDIFRKDGGIDIYAVATRAQRLAHKNRERLEKELEAANSRQDLRERMLRYREEILEEPEAPNLNDYLKAYHHTGQGEVVDGDRDDDVPLSETTGTNFEDMSNDASFIDFARAELEHGSQFITFRIDDPGPVAESFSNTAGESELANKINSMSSRARSTRFDFAGGNLGDGPILGTVQNVVGSVKGLIDGAMESVRISGLASLTGSAFVDIPKHWQSSTANLPRASYTIELRSPYGNPMSRYMNLIVPLSMLLAAALPISTGKQSYTSPFLVELYSKGRNQIRLGMVDSLSITRGTGNVGWTPDGEPLGIDISFSVVDLSTVMHMPVAPSFGAVDVVLQSMGGAIGRGIGAATSAVTEGDGATGQRMGENVAAAIDRSNFDDDNAFTDYMAVLGSLSLADQIYPTNRLRLRRAQRMARWEQWKSPAHHANWLLGSTPARMLSAFTHQTDRGQD